MPVDLYLAGGRWKVEAPQESREHRWNVRFPVNVANVVLSQSCKQPNQVILPDRRVVTVLPELDELVKP